MKTYICNKVAAVTVPSDLQSGGAEGAHLQCAVDYKSTYSMPADYKSTGTFSQRPIANSLFRKAASVLCTLCSVLLITSCTQEEITAPQAAVPQGMKTVTVDFQMPSTKPAFDVQSTGTRGISNSSPESGEVPAGGRGLSETDFTDPLGASATPPNLGGELSYSASRATDGALAEENLSSLISHLSTRSEAAAAWQSGNELLMQVVVAGFEGDEGWTTYTSYVTLTCDGTAWDVVADKSTTVRSQGEFGNYTYTNPGYVMLAQTADISFSSGLGIMVPEEITVDERYPDITIFYTPEAEWNITPDANGTVTDVALKLKATAKTAAPEAWTLYIAPTIADTPTWTTNQARLRIYTGQAGDVVTLTSEEFYPNNVDKAADGIYTATTDANGNAYFYGTAGEMDESDNLVALTSGFNVSLTGVKVGEDDAAITCPVSPVTLLEASALVPVKLDAGVAYHLDASAKRTAAADGIAIVSGSETDLEAVKAAIAGKTTVIVTGASLAGYSSEDDMALTVVGEAIRQLTLDDDGNSDSNSPNCGTINLVLPEVTEIGQHAFYSCSALTSVSAPAATSIGNSAFNRCTKLTSVSLPAATTIGAYVFCNCAALTSVSLPAATSIEHYAFSNCDALTSVSADAATSIGNYAFSNCIALTSVSLPATTSIGSNAFYYCTALTSVSLPAATSIGSNAFHSCTDLTSLTFGKVITTVGTNSFTDANTENCHLTLAAGQESHEKYPAEAGENKTWADYTWASITVTDSN